MLSSRLEIPCDPIHLGRILDLLFEIAVFEHQLMSLVKTAGGTSRSHRSRLQTSIRSNRKQHQGDQSTKPLAPFLAKSVHDLHLMMDQARESLQYIDGPTLKTCLAYLVDLFDIGNSPTFDEAIFQVYLGLGRALVVELQSQGMIKTPIETLEKGLDQFISIWQLSSGQSMELIWTACRPPTPETLPQLELKMQIEQLADRFDKALWIGDAPLEEMDRLRQSLWQLVANGEAGDNFQADDIIKVFLTQDALQNVLTCNRTFPKRSSIWKQTTLAQVSQRSHTFNQNLPLYGNIKPPGSIRKWKTEEPCLISSLDVRLGLGWILGELIKDGSCCPLSRRLLVLTVKELLWLGLETSFQSHCSESCELHNPIYPCPSDLD